MNIFFKSKSLIDCCRDGTVNRTLCVTAFGGNCEVKMTNGQVKN